MKSNRVISVILLAFVIFWGYFTTRLPETTLEGEPGPKFFPTIILGLMALLSVFLFFTKDKQPEAVITFEESEEDEEVPQEETVPMVKTLAFYGLFFLVLILTYFVGFLPGLIVGMTALLLLTGWKLLRSVIFSVIATVGVFLLFDTLFKIPLPTGVLF